MDAAVLNSLNYHSPHANIGRPMKVCKGEIAGLITALKNYEKTDHDAQWNGWRRQSRFIVDELQGFKGLRVCLEDGDPNRQGPQAVIYFEETWDGPSQAEILESLSRSEPPVYIGSGGYRDELWVSPVNLMEGEERIIVEKLKEILKGN